MLSEKFFKIRLEYLWKKKYSISPLAIIHFLEKSQYLSRNQIERYQLEKIKFIINHAINYSTYYQDKFKTKQEIRILGDMIELPYLSKEIIRENAEDIFIKSDQKKYFTHTTSGSTGDPLVVFVDPLTQAFRIADFISRLGWWGIYPSDKNVLIWGKKDTNQVKRIHPLKRIIKNIYQRNFFINVFDLNSKTISDLYYEIRNFHPIYIRGYTSAVLQFAELLKNQRLEGSKLKIQHAIVTSEVLLDEQRKFIEEELKCNVINEYGAAETGLIAFECPLGKMHINEESLYIFSNEYRELIITDLNNVKMPIINYNIGDKVEISNEVCTCGRHLRVIKKIDGRIGDFIIKPNGEHLSQYTIYYIVKELDDLGFSRNIKKYKLIQKGTNFDFIFVKDIAYHDGVKSYIAEKLYSEIGKNININFHSVEKIPRDTSGKIRFFVRQE